MRSQTRSHSRTDKPRERTHIHTHTHMLASHTQRIQPSAQPPHTPARAPLTSRKGIHHRGTSPVRDDGASGGHGLNEKTELGATETRGCMTSSTRPLLLRPALTRLDRQLRQTRRGTVSSASCAMLSRCVDSSGPGDFS